MFSRLLVLLVVCLSVTRVTVALDPSEVQSRQLTRDRLIARVKATRTGPAKRQTSQIAPKSYARFVGAGIYGVSGCIPIFAIDSPVQMSTMTLGSAPHAKSRDVSAADRLFRLGAPQRQRVRWTAP
jgi:hypothetical protein